MPDSLSMELSLTERRNAADRLWKIIAMTEAGKSMSDIRGALLFTVQEIEPFGALYDDRPINGDVF